MGNKSTVSENDIQLLNPEDFFLEIPIYKSFEVKESWKEEENKAAINIQGFSCLLDDVKEFGGTLDAFCIECKQNSVFEVFRPRQGNHSTFDYGEMRPPTKEELENRAKEICQESEFSVKFECTRDRNHKMLFYFRIHNWRITKIGQYPSLADLYSGEISKYRKILGEDKYRELSKGVGLAAHGVGIGSFIYLRRIFESLVKQAHQEASNQPEWSEESEKRYNDKRAGMSEKIELLKDFLPSFLVDNSMLYSIMSKGIHDLSEEECLRYFKMVKVGIELVLDEKFQEEEKRKKLSAASNAIARVKGELS